MLLKKEKPLALKGSTSAICNNLSVHVNLDKNLINYAVAHKSVVNLVSASTDGSSVNHRQIVCKEPSATPQGNIIVIQSKLVALPTRSILVITSQRGIQMFEADGSVMLYWYALGDSSHGEVNTCFGRGICGIGDDTICVGNHEGHILVFDIPARGTNITLSDTIKGHRSPICDLAASGSHLVSSDEAGNLHVWQAGDTFSQITKIPGQGSPCSSVAMWHNLVIAGYGSGHLRMFNAKTGRQYCEAMAHAKWITALDVAPSSGKLLTAGEDAFVRLWQLRTGPQPELEHVHSEHVKDLQLQGAKFISEDGRAFGVTGYDNNEIIFYTTA